MVRPAHSYTVSQPEMRLEELRSYLVHGKQLSCFGGRILRLFEVILWHFLADFGRFWHVLLCNCGAPFRSVGMGPSMRGKHVAQLGSHHGRGNLGILDGKS